MSKSFAGLSLALLAAALVACGGEPTASPAATPAASSPELGRPHIEGVLLAVIRRATARYHRIEVALADGYVQGSPCESSPAGGMGAHFRKNALIDGVIDPAHPEILQYEPQQNGEWRLVGVEFLVPAAAWDPTHSGPPTFAGHAFEDRRAPGSGGPPFPNYGLHLWVWQHNPSGTYAPWNPTVSCEFAP